MPIACALEHNGNDSLLYAVNYPGAFARGKTKEEALGKIPAELTAYCRWCGIPIPEDLAAVITQEKESRLSATPIRTSCFAKNALPYRPRNTGG